MRHTLLTKYIAYGIIFLISISLFFFSNYNELADNNGNTMLITGSVIKSGYVSKGDIIDLSYTEIYLDNGNVYRLPLGEMVVITTGDQVELEVVITKSENEVIPVISWRRLNN